MSTTLLSVFLLTLLMVFVYMCVWFALAMLTKRNDIADIAWGLGFMVVTYGTLLHFNEWSLATVTNKQWLVAGLVTVWGIRLATHVFMRNHGKPEDARYKQWREDWGKWFIPRTFLQVFMLQGFMLVLISMPIQVVNGFDFTGEFIYVNFIGVAIWLIGLFFEAVGDYQLLQFLKNPANKGKIMTSGLWKYTRHPNYFGEIAMWWGIWLVTFGVANSAVAIIGPLTITILLTKVSGIPMTERRMKDRPEFIAYARKTSVLIPWFPKQ